MINTVPLSYRTTITERNMHPEAFLDARPYARKRVANIDEAIDTYYHLRFHQSEQFDHVDHFGQMKLQFQEQLVQNVAVVIAYALDKKA
ncbi:hypothetical protein Tco_0544034 [Tanacetum coccineum]